MKKVLSVFLAVLMLFGALSVGSFAEDGTTTTTPAVSPKPYHAWWEKDGGPCTAEQVVIAFNLNGGTLKNEAQVYNEETGKFEWKKGKDISGTYYMVPEDKNTMKGGMSVVLPLVNAPDGRQFNGWEVEVCVDTSNVGDTSYVGNTYAANAEFKIPVGARGTLIQMKASYSAADFEEPTITKVIGILMKVFGTIIGLIAYEGDTKKGIAFMEKVFGGLFD